MVISAVTAGLYCLIHKPDWYPRHSPAGAFVAATVVAICVGIVLNLSVDRLHYDYRHLVALSLATLVLVMSWWPAREARISPAAAGVSVALVALCLLANIDLFRYTLAPLAWGDDAMTYDQAAAAVRSVIPPGATVGGDGSVWTVIDDGRPFISTRVAADEYWPDYLVCATWARVPPMAQRGTAEKLAREYEEVTPPPRLPVDGDGLSILGLRLPIATGRSDWYMRVWKRKGLSATDEEPPARADDIKAFHRAPQTRIVSER